MNNLGKHLLVKISMVAVVLIIFGALASTVTGCTNSAAGEAADKEKVEEVFDDYASFAKDGDLEQWISLWSEDGKRLAPNAPASVGVEEIRAAVGPLFELFYFEEFNVDPDGVRILGDEAYVHGTYGFLLTPKAGGNSIEDSGKFLTILEKQGDGSWKIAIDSFNTSLPAPAP